MKKLLCFIISIIIAMCFISCTKNESTVILNNQYVKKYDFYKNSIELISDKMNLDSQKANNLFDVLIKCGLAQEITSIYTQCKDIEDNSEYSIIYSGTDFYNVFLDNSNGIKKISNFNGIIYENGKFNEKAEDLDNKQQTTKAAKGQTEIQKEVTTNKEENTQSEKKDTATNNEADSQTITVVINTKTNVYHKNQGCGHAKRMKEANKLVKSFVNIDAVISAGYKPCGTCSKR